MKLQASDASALEGLQSQNLSRQENRLSVNGLAIVHRRLRKASRSSATAEGIVPLILPIAALVVVGDLHRDDVFRILESKLGRHAYFHREPISRKQDLVAKHESHQGLRVQNR